MSFLQYKRRQWMALPNNIIFHSIPTKLINGSLFYCFEYFVFANNFRSTELLIHDITQEDLDYLIGVFKDRYKFKPALLSKIKILEKKTDLIKTKYHRTMFLDVRSFGSLHQFVNNETKEILCYSNGPHSNIRSQYNNITYYGIYDYQVFDKEELLRFNFDIFKPIKDKKTDTAYFSTALNPGENTLINKMDVKENKVIYKTPSGSTKKLFDSFDTLYYFHTSLDRNNRLIPESFYYGKEVVLVDNGSNDSVSIRYKDILENGIEKYGISKTDVLVLDFIKD